MLPSNPKPPNCNMACGNNLQKNYSRLVIQHTLYVKDICRIIRRYVILEKKTQMCWTISAKEIKRELSWRPASEDNNVTLCWGVCDSTIFKRGYRPGRSDWYPRVCMHKPRVDATRWISPYYNWKIQWSTCWRTQSRPVWTRHRTVLPISMKKFKKGKYLGIS